MSGTTLFTIAYEMLRKTNPYKKDVSEIAYHLGEEKKSLLDIVANNLAIYRGGERAYSKNNFSIVYEEISSAMVEYLEEFRSSFSFKQRTLEKFYNWLKDIRKQYHLDEVSLAEQDLDAKLCEKDICIAMLKELHARDGVSKKDLYTKLGEHPRSIQKNLRKLSPDLYRGEKENISDEAEYVPFQIGGQPVTAKIKIKKHKGDRSPYFYTPNTIHPIVLQENLMQVGTLLQSLCRNYYDFESSISIVIATDIWSQLSEYAKEKIKNIYTVQDQDFQEFVEILDDECPDDYASSYRTEREIADNEGLSLEDKLRFLAKAPMRSATIIITKDDERIKIVGACVKDYREDFVAVTDSKRNEYEFLIQDLQEILLN